jgi:hypothetical protein
LEPLARSPCVCPLRHDPELGRGRGEKAQRRIPTDYLDWALSDFSGYIAADELYDGPFCVLSIVDNRTFKWLSYHVLDRDPTQVDVAAFFRRFRQALEARGLTVQGITTDGSTLYPEPIATVFGAVPHQVCQFPHPARGEQGGPLGRGPGTQASGGRRPQIAAGPSPSSKAAKRAARRKERIEQKVVSCSRTGTCSSSGGSARPSCVGSA